MKTLSAEMDIKGKKIAVIGVQRSGLGVVDLVQQKGGIARVSDSAPTERLSGDIKRSLTEKGIPLELGAHTQKFIEESDYVVLSPGVRADADPVKWARAKNIPVLGEIEFAWRFCSKPVIAVTGSNGKTTSVHLISEVLRAAGKKVCLCGNVGTAFSSQVLNLKDTDYVVLEVSSFQLESIIEFRPYVAVFLNFSQNHLDRHKDLAEYLTAKQRIFSNQTAEDYAVLNDQDATVKGLAKSLKSKVRFFNSPQQIAKTGITNPNFLVALTVGEILGIPANISSKVFKEFKGVEHRQEFVRTIRGVDFINDSKSTTAEATRWALERAFRPLILICGGRDKGIDYTPLRPLVRQKVKKVLVIGEAREKIKKAFHDVVDIEECLSLEKAVDRALAVGQEGDCVLLSPMCASFDMFRDYEDRGRTFKNIVRELKAHA